MEKQISFKFFLSTPSSTYNLYIIFVTFPIDFDHFPENELISVFLLVLVWRSCAEAEVQSWILWTVPTYQFSSFSVDLEQKRKCFSGHSGSSRIQIEEHSSRRTSIRDSKLVLGIWKFYASYYSYKYSQSCCIRLGSQRNEADAISDRIWKMQRARHGCNFQFRISDTDRSSHQNQSSMLED